jgi:phosphotransferase system HPr (HPr) family protein
MISKEIKIRTPNGLHLRVAAKIVQANKDSKTKIVFFKDGQTADASSILELLLLGATENSNIHVTVDGENEHVVIQNVSGILIDGAGI